MYFSNYTTKEIYYSDNQKTCKQEDDFQNQGITLKSPMSMRQGSRAVLTV